MVNLLTMFSEVLLSLFVARFVDAIHAVWHVKSFFAVFVYALTVAFRVWLLACLWIGARFFLNKVKQPHCLFVPKLLIGANEAFIAKFN